MGITYRFIIHGCYGSNIYWASFYNFSFNFCFLISYFASSQLSIHFGISTNFSFLTLNEATILSIILLAGVLSSMVPAFITYRNNLNQTFS